MNQRAMVAITLSLICGLMGCALWIKHSPHNEEFVRYPGSYIALDFWRAERTYPHEQFPAQGMVQGMRRMKASEMHRGFKKTDPWRAMGPWNQSGRTLALAVDPTNPDLLFAGSASGGLWRTQTGGKGGDWERIETGFPVLGVGAIAINPKDRNHIFIGTGEVYGYQNASPGVGERITRGSYGFGILQSRDRGETWSLSLDWQLHQERGVQDLKIDPNRTNVIWSATTEGVYKSTNSGDSWERVLDVVMATSLEIMTPDGLTVIAACGGFSSPGHGLYRTVDGGLNWEQLTLGLPVGFKGKAMLGQAPSKPGTIYLTMGDSFQTGDPESKSYLFRSVDYGSQWRLMNNTDFASYQGWYSHYVRVDPSNDSRIFVGGVKFYNSTNGGRRLNETFGFDHHAMAIAPSDPQIMYIAYDQGISRSENRGSTWEAVNYGYQTTQFYNGMAQSAQSDLFIGAPQDQSQTVGYRGSKNWELSQLGHEASYIVIDPVDDNIRYYAGPGFALFERTGNVPGNAQWPGYGRTTSVAFNAPLVGTPANPNVLYMARNDVVRSNDRGNSWTATNGGAPLEDNPILTMAVSPVDENKVYAATIPLYGAMSVFKTLDGGVQWTRVAQGLSNPGGLPNRYPKDLILDPHNDELVYLVFSGFGSSHVYRSHDGGLNWEDIDQGRLPDAPTHALIVDPENSDILYVGNDLGVFATLNGGAEWFSFSEGLPSLTMVADLHIYNEKRLLRMGSHGNGAWERALLASDALVPPFRYQLAEVGGDMGPESHIGIVNPSSDVTAQVELTAYNSSGLVLDIHELQLKPLAHVDSAILSWFNFSDLAWIEVSAPIELDVFAEFREDATSAAVPATRGSYQNYIPHVAQDTSQFETVVSAVNTGKAGNGARMKQFPLETSTPAPELDEAYGSASSDVRHFFGDDLTGVSWADLIGSQPVSAVEYFTRLPNKQERAAIPLSGETHNDLYFLHVAQNTQIFWTGIVYINPNSSQADVTEKYYSQDGVLLTTKSRALPPGEKQTLLFDETTSADGQIPIGTAWVHASSDQRLMGYQLFGSPTKTNHDLFAGLAASGKTGSHLGYAFLHAGEGRWTGIVAVNTGDIPDAMTFSLLNADGQVLAQKTVDSIAAKGKVVILARDLFPDQIEQGAWIRGEAQGSQWSGYSLWGDDGSETRHFLSGLEAFIR